MDFNTDPIHLINMQVDAELKGWIALFLIDVWAILMIWA